MSNNNTVNLVAFPNDNIPQVDDFRRAFRKNVSLQTSEAVIFARETHSIGFGAKNVWFFEIFKYTKTFRKSDACAQRAGNISNKRLMQFSV